LKSDPLPHERRASVCNNFSSALSGIAPSCSENRGQPFFCRRISLDSTVIEICTRLGLALVLSVTLAVLLAWGWDSSDPLPIDSDRIVEAPGTQTPAQ